MFIHVGLLSLKSNIMSTFMCEHKDLHVYGVSYHMTMSKL